MSIARKLARIYVVEDELIVARDIRMQLTDMGYEAAGHSATAEEALEKVRAAVPDLVLMDINLAGTLDGIGAAQIVRTELDIPVVFLTAFTADDVLARAKLTEPYGYILKPFSERELRTVLEMALYKSQAERTMRQDSRQLKQMAQRVMEVQESERRKLALELHDELGQSLTAIKINMETRKRLDASRLESFDRKTTEIIDDAILKVRNLALSLRPGLLDDLGLLAALEWMVNQRSFTGNIVFELESNLGPQRLPAAVETTFFRVAQEAVTNVQRHSQASHAYIGLTRTDADLTLVVHDNGTGFDLPAMAQKAASGKSLGMTGMQERALLIGARIDVTMRPDGRSQVQLFWPFNLEPTRN
jgi:signal transduction histidine kinase